MNELLTIISKNISIYMREKDAKMAKVTSADNERSSWRGLERGQLEKVR